MPGFKARVGDVCLVKESLTNGYNHIRVFSVCKIRKSRWGTNILFNAVGCTYGSYAEEECRLASLDEIQMYLSQTEAIMAGKLEDVKKMSALVRAITKTPAVKLIQRNGTKK